MANDRIQRRIDRLLDEADQAVDQRDWAVVQDRAQQVLTFDPEHTEALGFLAAADRSLAGAPLAAADVRVSTEASATSSDPLPSSFADGRYQVKRFLGEGGKKRVYLAHDELLDRDVAFALIKTEGLDEAGRTRISREAQAMGRLGSHPHIVTVFDIGQHDGQPYMVTELMEGGDVEGIVEEATESHMPLDKALIIAREVCQGLEFAHEKSIVHRDLKPGNVWLTGAGTAKIGDFGLAVSVDRSRLTAEGMMVGTVSYMPPEQAMGGEVTAKADLYSLGAMLYEMVTGRPPFLGDDSVAIIGQHLNTPPVAPTWHNPEVPTGLETLIMRLLEKDPSNRPASAQEVSQALESIDLTAPIGSGTVDEPATTMGQDPLYRRTFVGREAELRQLHTAFDGAMSGEGSLQMVVGEPGIGKTTLCEQLATYVALRGGMTLIGHCYEEGSMSLPYLAFVEAMRSYVLERDTDDLKKALGSGAAEVARIVSEVRERVEVEPSESGDPEEDRYRLLQAVSGFLRNAASVQPLLVVLEDLHDADRGTLDMLVHVARNLSGARLLILGTYRDVEVDRAHALSGVLAELRGLTADEVRRMMSGIAGQAVPWGLSEAVHRQTEGNPLFVQEVLRYLVEEGLLHREGGRLRETGQEQLAMSIPEGLRDVIGKRLARLSEGCNRVLAVAAVVGRDFRLDVLQDVAAISEEELYAALEEAGGAAVIEERSSVGGVVTFWFTHAFFRQTLYEETFASRRFRLHQQVGRSLEEIHSSRLEDHASELAEHFAQSTELEDLAKALSYGEMAAERAMSVYAYSEAAGHLERCLQVHEVLSPEDKTKRCDLLLSLAEALMPAGEPQRVYETVAAEAFELAEAIADRSRASRSCRAALEAILRYAGVAAWGSQPEHRQWASRSDEYSEPGTPDRVFADLAMAVVRAIEGNSTDARVLVVRALELARKLDDPEALYRAATLFIQSPPVQQEEERWGLVREMAAHPHVGVAPRTLGPWLQVSVEVCTDWGDRARAERISEELSQLAERTYDATVIVRSLVAPSWAAFLDGRLEEAVSAAEGNRERAEELGAPAMGRLFAFLMSFRPLLYLGRDEAMAAMAAMPGKDDAGSRWPLFVMVRAYLGFRDEAEDGLRRLMTEHDVALQGESLPTFSLVILLETAILVEDRKLCTVLAQRLAPVAFLSNASVARTCPARHLGAAAALLGEPDKARGYYQQALEEAGKIRFRPEIALTRFQLAELLLEHYPDERAEAMEHLDFAVGEFRDMKMQPSLERALSHRDILKA